MLSDLVVHCELLTPQEVGPAPCIPYLSFTSGLFQMSSPLSACVYVRTRALIYRGIVNGMTRWCSPVKTFVHIGRRLISPVTISTLLEAVDAADGLDVRNELLTDAYRTLRAAEVMTNNIFFFAPTWSDLILSTSINPTLLHSLSLHPLTGYRYEDQPWYI